MGGFIMSACSVCGSEPCTNPSFCATCRGADRRKVHGQPLRYIEASRWRGPPNHIPRNWNEISLEALIAHFDGARPRSGAPQPTVEGLMYALRKGGSALNESSNLRRLGELSEPQLHELCARLQKFKPHIARAWTPAEIEALVVTWTEVKNG